VHHWNEENPYATFDLLRRCRECECLCSRSHTHALIVYHRSTLPFSSSFPSAVGHPSQTTTIQTKLTTHRTLLIPEQHKHLPPHHRLPQLRRQLRHANLQRRQPNRAHGPQRRTRLDLPHVLQRRHPLLRPRPPLGDTSRSYFRQHFRQFARSVHAHAHHHQRRS
jgi:hypothetical protein